MIHSLPFRRNTHSSTNSVSYSLTYCGEMLIIRAISLRLRGSRSRISPLPFPFSPCSAIARQR